MVGTLLDLGPLECDADGQWLAFLLGKPRVAEVSEGLRITLQTPADFGKLTPCGEALWTLAWQPYWGAFYSSVAAAMHRPRRALFPTERGTPPAAELTTSSSETT